MLLGLMPYYRMSSSYQTVDSLASKNFDLIITFIFGDRNGRINNSMSNIKLCVYILVILFFEKHIDGVFN